MKRGSQSFRRIFVTASGVLEIIVLLTMPAVVFAQQASSTNYSVNEAFFGTGGQLCDPGVAGNSTNYCAKSSVGELGVGNTASTNYQAQAGNNTNREEYIQASVNDAQCPGAGSSIIDLGYLSTSSTKTASVNFSVKSYLASGYVVQTVGVAPTSGGPSPHTMTTQSSPTGSTIGSEQFGINLRANTTPVVGNDITQLPSSSFSYGQVNTNYNTPNSFMYVNGDPIANSPSSSGTTCYDMSYIFNISGVTPTGTYTFNQSIVATSTF